jgi:hypothetical protein
MLDRLSHSLDAAEARLALDRGFRSIPGSSDDAAATASSSSPSLYSVISSMRSSINALSQTVVRQDANVMNETVHLQEDVQSLRAAVYGLRMQFSGHLMRCRFGSASPSTASDFGMERSFDPSSLPRPTATTSRNWDSQDPAAATEDGSASNSSSPPIHGPPRFRYPFMPGMPYLPTTPYPRRFSNQETKL